MARILIGLMLLASVTCAQLESAVTSQMIPVIRFPYSAKKVTDKAALSGMKFILDKVAFTITDTPTVKCKTTEVIFWYRKDNPGIRSTYILRLVENGLKNLEKFDLTEYARLSGDSSSATYTGIWNGNLLVMLWSFDKPTAVATLSWCLARDK